MAHAQDGSEYRDLGADHFCRRARVGGVVELDAEEEPDHAVEETIETQPDPGVIDLQRAQLESAAPAEFQEPIEIEWSSLRVED